MTKQENKSKIENFQQERQSEISRKDQKFIEEAIRIASSSPCYCQHGCVLVQNGRIVGRGYNNQNWNSSHQSVSISCQTIHAEIGAITQYFKQSKQSIKKWNKFKEKEQEQQEEQQEQ